MFMLLVCAFLQPLVNDLRSPTRGQVSASMAGGRGPSAAAGQAVLHLPTMPSSQQGGAQPAQPGPGPGSPADASQGQGDRLRRINIAPDGLPMPPVSYSPCCRNTHANTLRAA